MSVRKSDDFIRDIEQQFNWYVKEAGWDLAERYLAAVESACRLLGRHPQLGPAGGFRHPRLLYWRFFLVSRPFHKHIIFYEIVGEDVLMRRSIHGKRDLPRRLLEPPQVA